MEPGDGNFGGWAQAGNVGAITKAKCCSVIFENGVLHKWTPFGCLIQVNEKQSELPLDM